MAKVDFDSMSQQETVQAVKDGIATLTFEDVWTILMESWDDSDKEEAFARLDEQIAISNDDTTNADC